MDDDPVRDWEEEDKVGTVEQEEEEERQVGRIHPLWSGGGGLGSWSWRCL